MNVYRIDIESNESGADYEDAAPASGGTLKDTYLNAAFWVGGTERCLYLTGNGESRAFAAADQFVGVGVWDEVLVFGNSTKYGGCGGAVGVSSINSSSDEIQIHEFGHSFASLADEYDYGSSSTTCNPSSSRNVDCSNSFPNVKWDVWVTPGAPIPTPETAQYNTTIGAFEGAAYQVSGMFRPKQDCRMRTLGVSFCPVCKEAHILKLFEKFNIVDAANPVFGSADVPTNGTRTFTVTPVNINSFSYRWILNGAVLPNATNASVVISNSQVTFSNIQLRLEATHVSTNVRAQTIVQSNYVWSLHLAPAPSLTINDITLTEGDSGSKTARFTVTLSFPHSSPVTVNFNTTNGSAKAGADYTATNGLLTFAPGVTTNFVDVPVLGDTLPEPHEVFFVNLSKPTNALLVDRQGSALIFDNDTPPLVTLTNPTPGSVFFVPANISIGADAYDPDGNVAKVEFFAGVTKIGTVSNGPATMVWSNVPAGSYVLRAVATDNALRTGTSAPVSIYVIAGGTQHYTYLSITNAWRYDQTTNDYGTAWKEIVYDDSGWLGPSAALLYVEGATLPAPKNTPLILTNNGVRLRTHYFRTQFTSPVALDSTFQVIASNLVDDGAVFYLNGTETNRLRITGTTSRTSLANSTPPNGGDATAFELLTFPPGLIVAGNNVMAVEVHQQSDTSSDVVFGMSLDAVQGFAPIILDTNRPADQLVLQGQSLVLSINATGAPGPFYQWYRNGSPLAAATNATYQVASMTSGNAGNYFVRATNQLGFADSRTATVGYSTDTAAPVLLYALGSNTPTRIIVVFSEPVVTGATTIGNYVVTSMGDGSSLAVSAAALLNSTSVVLTTAARIAGTNYQLTVNNVRDAFNNIIATNSTVIVGSELIVLAADNQSWRYYQNGTEPGAGWTLPWFDDAADNWFSGPALFDAKNPPGRTTVNGIPVRTMLNLTNPPTGGAQTLAYYFRAPFVLPGTPVGARLRLRTMVDDGAVYYLNGQEVFRLRMTPPPVNIGYTNVATSAPADAQIIFEGPYDLPAGALVKGTNIFAVEVHQATATSSDITFAAQLNVDLAMFGVPAPVLNYVRNASATNLFWIAPDALLQEAPTVSGPWADISPAPTNTYYLTNSPGARFFRLRVP